MYTRAGLLLFCVQACGFGLVASGRAETLAAKRQHADQLVAEAMHREIYGMEEDRSRLLQEALDLEPDHSVANWHLGKLRYQKRWVPAEELQQVSRQKKRLERYVRERAVTRQTAAGQLELANWCAENGFGLQEIAHLNRVIQLDPEHHEARARLGYLRGRLGWIHVTAIWQGLNDPARHAASVKRWRSELEDIRLGLARRSNKARQSAMERLLAIRDVSAIPAIESLLASHSQAMAHAAVAALGNMSQHEASLALARIAVFSPWQDVHDTAAQQLAQRPREGYVPALLAEMSSPIESRFQIALIPRAN